MPRNFWLLLLGFPLVSSRVSLVNNGYKGLVVAISPEEQENSGLIDSIKTLFTSASAELFKVTGGRAFFEEVTILIPMAWNLSVEGSVDETFEEAEFRVAPSNPAYGHNPYTIQVKYTLLKLFLCCRTEQSMRRAWGLHSPDLLVCLEPCNRRQSGVRQDG